MKGRERGSRGVDRQKQEKKKEGEKKLTENSLGRRICRGVRKRARR